MSARAARGGGRGQTPEANPASKARVPTAEPADEIPPDLRVCTLTAAGVEYLVVSFSFEADKRRTSGPGGHKLTACEREVAAAAAAGLSNREIASLRRTSCRTVANQLSSIFRKLGIGSRAGLAAYWHASPSRKSSGPKRSSPGP